MIQKTNYMARLSQFQISNCTWTLLETLGEIGIKNCPNIHALIISNQSDGFGTLLTITEANYMRFNEFKKGQIVKWKDEIGEVNFIDKMYITLCLHRWNKDPEIAKHLKPPPLKKKQKSKVFLWALNLNESKKI